MKTIPPYVYRQEILEYSLLQGDILKVDGQFRQFFTEFYPKINHSENVDKYVMVLTQSCDLVKSIKRKPKIHHINVCLVRSLRSVTDRFIKDEIKPHLVANVNLLERVTLDKLKDKLSKLLNNSDQKTHFFLPKHSPFIEDMVAILPLSFSFRTEHYELLLQSRVLGLKSDFQAKVGHIISQLYGRIGTPDLSDQDWDDKNTRDYIKHLLQDSNLIQVPDKSFISYIIDNLKKDQINIHELIQECEAIKIKQSFKPLENELFQKVKSLLTNLFEDQPKINKLLQMGKKELSKEIINILKTSCITA